MANLLNLKNNEILSARGSVSVDERTNTIIVKDTNDSLVNVRRLLDQLDIPIRQVLIESRIVIANDDFSKELGVRFGVSSDTNGANTTGSGTGTSGTLNGTTQLFNNDTLEAVDRYNVNLPVANPTGTFALALAKLPLGTLLEMELSAAQVEGRGEVVSSPRIITSNSHAAKIEQGVEIPYTSTDIKGKKSTIFKKAVLKLEVTPQITPDNHIIMDLSVHKDSQGLLTQDGPTINTRNIDTQVLVNNGQTVVLGGIHETVQSKQVSRVPFFSDLPLIGNLFKTTLNVDDRSELLIFVTPKILTNGIVSTR
jgi:type IV pilus assembly protein PilQ